MVAEFRVLDGDGPEILLRFGASGELTYVDTDKLPQVFNWLWQRSKQLEQRVQVLEAQYAAQLACIAHPLQSLSTAPRSGLLLPADNTMSDLLAFIGQRFECRGGNHNAHAYGVGVGSSPEILHEHEPYRYRTLAYVTTNPDRPQIRLRERLAQDICTLWGSCPRGKHLLYWRFEEPEQIEEEQGALSPSGCPAWKIRTRIAIPAADWNVVTLTPDGAAYPSID